MSAVNSLVGWALEETYAQSLLVSLTRMMLEGAHDDLAEVTVLFHVAMGIDDVI